MQAWCLVEPSCKVYWSGGLQSTRFISPHGVCKLPHFVTVYGITTFCWRFVRVSFCILIPVASIENVAPSCGASLCRQNVDAEAGFPVLRSSIVAKSSTWLRFCRAKKVSELFLACCGWAFWSTPGLDSPTIPAHNQLVHYFLNHLVPCFLHLILIFFTCCLWEETRGSHLCFMKASYGVCQQGGWGKSRFWGCCGSWWVRRFHLDG